MPTWGEVARPPTLPLRLCLAPRRYFAAAVAGLVADHPADGVVVRDAGDRDLEDQRGAGRRQLGDGYAAAAASKPPTTAQPARRCRATAGAPAITRAARRPQATPTPAKHQAATLPSNSRRIDARL